MSLAEIMTLLEAEPVAAKTLLWDPGDIEHNVTYEAAPTGKTSTWDLSADPGRALQIYEEVCRISGTMMYVENDPYEGDNVGGSTVYNDGQQARKLSIGTDQGASFVLKMSPFGANNQNADYDTAGLNHLYDTTGYVATAMEAFQDRIGQFQGTTLSQIILSWEGWSSVGLTNAEMAVRLARYNEANALLESVFPDVPRTWYLDGPHTTYQTAGFWDRSYIGRYSWGGEYDDHGDKSNFEIYRPYSTHYIGNVFVNAERYDALRSNQGSIAATVLYCRSMASWNDANGINYWNDGSWQANGVEYPLFNDYWMGYLYGNWDEAWVSTTNNATTLSDTMDWLWLYAFPLRRDSENSTYHEEWLFRFLLFLRGMRKADTDDLNGIRVGSHTYGQAASDYM